MNSIEQFRFTVEYASMLSVAFVVTPTVNRRLMEELRQFVRLEKEMLRRYHEKRDPGLMVCQAYAMIDVLLEFLYDNAVRGWLRIKISSHGDGYYGYWWLWTSGALPTQ